MQATLGIERELEDKLKIIDYHNGNGDFHFHSQIEICFVTSGEIDALVNNHLQRLKAGELSVALGYDTHLYTPVGDSYFSVLIIPADISEDFAAFVNNKAITNPFVCQSALTGRITKCFDEIRDHKNNALTVRGNVYMILGLIAENVVFEDRAAYGESGLISDILMYIHNNFCDDISLASVSRHFGYNPSYISHLFKSCFNIGIARYITVLRLKKAVSLLKGQKHGAVFCAFDSGFRSLRTFYRAFQNEFGCSPKEYLKKET
ncbi:MAG: helix-turn-helix domain-containing protein [Clostridia bacterium]|nr:helix-turn-helix domain-containing protein [Clostridia bacterium]